MNSKELQRTCGQLIVGGYEGHQPPATFTAALARGHLAGAIVFSRNLPDTQAAYESNRMLLDAVGNGTPPMLSIDQEGGRVQRLRHDVVQLPPMLTFGDTQHTGLLEQAAYALAKQLRALGFNLDFAPVLDINTNPDNPVIGDRAFGSDAAVVASFGAAWVRAFEKATVMSCGKHFPGHGDTDLDSHLALPHVAADLTRLRAVELVPFHRAIDAGVPTMMTAHIVCDEIDPHVPATLSQRITTGLLRSELGFQGVIFSDDLEMGAIAQRGDVGQAAVDAVQAGCDMLLVCRSEQMQREVHETLVKHAEQNSAFRDLCEQAAVRSISARERYAPTPAGSFADALDACSEALTATAQESLRALRA